MNEANQRFSFIFIQDVPRLKFKWEYNWFFSITRNSTACRGNLFWIKVSVPDPSERLGNGKVFNHHALLQFGWIRAHRLSAWEQLSFTSNGRVKKDREEKKKKKKKTKCHSPQKGSFISVVAVNFITATDTNLSEWDTYHSGNYETLRWTEICYNIFLA